MRFNPTYLSTCSLMFSSVFALPQGHHFAPRTVYQFPNPTWLENIAATCNGSLLTSTIGVAEVNLVDATSHPSTATLVHSFAGLDAVSGISELRPDIFAVIAGNYDASVGQGTNYSVWTIDLRNSRATPKVSKIVDVPGALLLNGMTTLNDNTLLISDSGNGHVVKLDVKTQSYSVVIDHPSMKPVPGSLLPIGINGVQLHKGYLYYSNTFQNIINRVKIDGEGHAVGEFETFASNVTLPDDFAIAKDGSVVVTRAIDNRVDRIWLDGRIETLGGSLNSSEIPGPTGVVLGRTRKDRHVAYVSTNGGQVSPINGTYTEGGKVVAVSLL